MKTMTNSIHKKKGILWGWNYIYEQGVFSDFRISFCNLQNAKQYIKDYVRIQKSKESYKNRKIIKKIHNLTE